MVKQRRHTAEQIIAKLRETGAERRREEYGCLRPRSAGRWSDSAGSRGTQDGSEVSRAL